jgi:hypothetical protein
MNSLAVLVTTYRRPSQLAVNLQSILDAGLQPVEVVVGDDSGDTGTQRVCAEFEPRLPLTRLELGGRGFASNVRSLLLHVSAEWLLILHDDNFLTGDHRPLLALLDDDCDLLFTDHHVALDDGSIDEARSDANSHKYGRTQLRDGPQSEVLRIAFGQVMATDGFYVRREIACAVLPRPAFGHVADYIWLLEVFLLHEAGLRLRYHAQRMFAYRLSADGITATGGGLNKHLVRGLTHVLRGVRDPELAVSLSSRISRNTWHAVNTALRCGDRRAAWHLLRGVRFWYRHSWIHAVLMPAQLAWLALPARRQPAS